MKKLPLLLAITLVGFSGSIIPAAEPLKALIIDGQNNHDWKSGTPVLKWILEDSGRFTVEVSTTPAEKAKPEAWQQWRPQFSRFKVVICNYTGDPWPPEVREQFTSYVAGGGGLVIVHAADNAFPEWPEYNEMIGLGGWGGRNEKSGPMVRWRDGKTVFDYSPGAGGTHGAYHEFVVEARDAEHPIMRGLPAAWRHAGDELYAKMRGPAKSLRVLATAYSAPDKGGTGEHEPMLMTIRFGSGRIFHTMLGHDARSMAGLGFQVTLARGAEWAATSWVTLPAVPAERLPADKPALRAPPKGRAN